MGKKSSYVKEISCLTGEIRVRLAPYKSYERVVLNTGINEKVHLARRLLNEAFEYSESEGELRRGHVNMPLDLVSGPDELIKLMNAIEKLAETPRMSVATIRMVAILVETWDLRFIKPPFEDHDC